MGQRTCKRVPLNFDWPMKQVWGGYVMPENLSEKPCADCDSSGYSPYARLMRDRWYGYAPFDPAETGSPRLTPDTPVVRAFAERNVSNAPGYYGRGETAIVREAVRLCDLWNNQWHHHLEQVDVDALIADGRLMDFTHTCKAGEGWRKIEPPPVVTAAEVNEWSIPGMGHDSINCSVVIRAKCDRDGQPEICDKCHGHGSIERYDGQRAEAEAWEWTEPPVGDGWQLWDTTSEGSPVSPVFAAAEELADWCADNATVFADMKVSRDDWLAMFVGAYTEAGSTMISTREVTT